MDNLKIATFGITMKMSSIIDAVLCCLFISPDFTMNINFIL